MQNNPYIELVMSLTPWGMKEGRDTVIELLHHLGSPQDTLKVFHVTGSNGKWSVCQMLAQVLWRQFQKKVGLFTSPHLIDITERFQINGVPITHKKLNTYYKKVFDLMRKYSIELSFFEIQVVVMVLYFTDENVEYAVIEVGLGWLYDGTNIFTHPLACFITSITLEHTYLLGKTRTAVLNNKLGIVKNWSKLYTHFKNKTVKTFCKKHHASLMTISKYSTKNLTNLPGNHQQKNALLVIQSLHDLWFNTEKILIGLKNIYNPGRFEWISSNILVDSANNRENINFLKNLLWDDASKSIILFGTTQTDPKYAAELAAIVPAKKRILVDGFCDRALPCSVYSQLVKHDVIWHLDTEAWKILLKTLIDSPKGAENYILYWSIYFVWYMMWLSRHNIFAKH